MAPMADISYRCSVQYEHINRREHSDTMPCKCNDEWHVIPWGVEDNRQSEVSEPYYWIWQVGLLIVTSLTSIGLSVLINVYTAVNRRDH